MAINRESWFEDIFSLVQPDEVRWIFVTHDDFDHAGNLREALQRCPNAQLITSHSESSRTSVSLGVASERMRMVDTGQSFDVGDRSLRALRPPVYDSPYTRGLFDPATGVYYSSDAFCAPMPEGPVDWVDQIPPQLWAEGMAKFHHFSLCPWISMVDEVRFRAEVGKLAELDIKVIVGAHTPPMRGASVPRAYQLLASLPSAIPPSV